MIGLRVAPRAEEQIRRVSGWWRKNRPAAPELFAHELADLLEALVATPTLGAEYAVRRGVTIRRLLLPRSRYHVYFSYDASDDVVDLRAVWGTLRAAEVRISTECMHPAVRCSQVADAS